MLLNTNFLHKISNFLYKCLKMKAKRRTPQEREQLLKLLADVRKRIDTFEITSYELAQNVSMTGAGIDKIIKGITKVPNAKVLNEIDVYIRENYETPPSLVTEPQKVYEKTSDELILKEVLKKLESLENKLDSSQLRQEIIFEILKNAKREEVQYLEKMFKEKFN